MRATDLIDKAEEMAANPSRFTLTEAQALLAKADRYRGPNVVLAIWTARTLRAVVEDEATPWGQDAPLPVAPGQLGLFEDSP